MGNSPCGLPTANNYWQGWLYALECTFQTPGVEKMSLGTEEKKAQGCRDGAGVRHASPCYILVLYVLEYKWFRASPSSKALLSVVL